MADHLPTSKELKALGLMEDPTPEERQAVVERAQKLAQKMIMQSVEHSTAEVLLASEMLISFRAAGAKMPLQEVMDNLFENTPRMYTRAVQMQALELKGETK